MAAQGSLAADSSPRWGMRWLVMLALTLPYFVPTLERLFEQGFGAVSAVMHAASGTR